MDLQIVQIPSFLYIGYATLYWLKKVMGLPTHMHRKFLMWKLIRTVQKGKIDRNKVKFTSMGKSDGAGAQALAKFSAMCFAKAYGFGYIHVPFSKLAHAEQASEVWDASWEHLLQMHSHHPSLDVKSMKLVTLSDFLHNPQLWNTEVVVHERHFHSFTELAPACCVDVAEELQGAFLQQHAQLRQPTSPFKILVHVRRGDVNVNDSQTKGRFTPNSQILTVVETVLAEIKNAAIDPEIHIHSNGHAEELNDFLKFPNVHLHPQAPALQAFTDLATADILISTQSDFSMLAGIYCPNIVICDPRHRAPLPCWIPAKPDSPNFRLELTKRLSQYLPDKVPSISLE